MIPFANETNSICNIGWRVNEIIPVVHMRALKEMQMTQNITMVILPIHRGCKHLSESVYKYENKHKSQN